MKKVLLGLSILMFTSCGKQFQWNFSQPRKFVYSFSQIVDGENRWNKDRPIDKTHMAAVGHVNVRVKENKLADLSLTDIEVKSVDYGGDGTPEDTVTTEMSTTVVQDMKADGSFDDSNADILFGLLFPLPNKSLKKGDVDEIPMQMPFNISGSRLFAKGQNTLTFRGYEEIEGRKCAVLNGIINISKLDIPEELKGEYKFSTTGDATYYFDLENGYYVGADIKLVMDVLVDSETENEDDFGIYTKMNSDNVYKIRLESIEE